MPNMGTAVSIFKQSSDPGSAATAGDLWSDTDNQALYRRNDANSAWLTLAQSTDVDNVEADITPQNLVQANSSTIGDYLQPESATGSSVDTSSTYSFNFDSASGWTEQDSAKISVNTSTERLEFDIRRDTTNDSISYDLGSALSETKWVMRFKMNFTAFVAPTTGGVVGFFGMSDKDSSNSAAVAQDFIGLVTRMSNSEGEFFGAVFNNAALSEPSSNQLGSDDVLGSNGSPSTVDWGIEIKRTSATSCTISTWTNQNFTGSASATATITIDTNYSGFRYIVVKNTTPSSSAKSNHLDGYIDDIEIWNDASDTSGHLASLAVDDSTTTYWQSNAETNPNIYVDCTGGASNVNLSQLALFPNSDSTETEIKIQYATNAGGTGSWTDARTITYSNLTNGEYNYIRFNNVIGRYVRIYGSSGASKILAINEIKTLEPSDADIRNDHGHLAISATDTSLALNGT